MQLVAQGVCLEGLLGRMCWQQEEGSREVCTQEGVLGFLG